MDLFLYKCLIVGVIIVCHGVSSKQWQTLVSHYSMSGTVLRTFYILTCLILTATLCNKTLFISVFCMRQPRLRDVRSCVQCCRRCMEARIQNRAIQFQGPFSLTLLVEALLITYCFSEKGEASDAWEKLPRGESKVSQAQGVAI